jgi:hypothetical protein
MVHAPPHAFGCLNGGVASSTLAPSVNIAVPAELGSIAN